MKRCTLALVGWISLLVAGCGALRDVEPGTASEPWVSAYGRYAATRTESLLMYFEYVHKLSAAELTKENETVRQLYARSRSDFNRVRYAMLLGVPGAAFGDEARAIEILDPLLKNADGALHALAFMLSAQIQEQRRGQGFQQKLEALKSLEKSMIERGR